MSFADAQSRSRNTVQASPIDRGFDAVIFDMDGVITRTAVTHSQAWKRMFDAYLRLHAERTQTPFREFTHAEDYLRHIDGRPRYQGVEGFLLSRGIRLAFGAPTDSPEQETVCGLGNRKNQLFNEIVEGEGVGLYGSTLELIRELQSEGVRIGLATSSRNSALILSKSGVASLFGSIVDGLVSERLGLRGKPAPDIFATAAGMLGVRPDRAIVVEDAVSGVQAGASGGFALVIGVAREDNAEELRLAGADLVVPDLAACPLSVIRRAVSARRA